MSSKQNTVLKAAHAIIQLEVAKGHLKWSVSDLVRKIGKSRMTIYRNFGSSKKEILLNAVRFFLEDYYDFSNVDPTTSFGERVGRARQRLSAYPEAVVLYHLSKSKSSWLVQAFTAADRKFEERLGMLYPHLSPDQIKFAHALIQGIVSAPFISAAEAVAFGDMLEKKFLKA